MSNLRGRLFLDMAVALAVILAVEFCVWRGEYFLRSDAAAIAIWRWSHPRPVEKRPRLLLFGDSGAACGFVPEVFDRELPELAPAYNFSYPALNVVGLYYRFAEFIRDNGAPDLLVMTLQPFFLKYSEERVKAAHAKFYFRAGELAEVVATTEYTPYALSEYLLSRSPVYRNRKRITSDPPYHTLLTMEAPEDRYVGPFTPIPLVYPWHRGFYLNRRPPERVGVPAPTWPRYWESSFEVSPSQDHYLRRLLDLTREVGTEVFFVASATGESLLQHRDGTGYNARQVEYFSRLIGEYPHARYLAPYLRPMPDDAFIDGGGHLWAEGAEVYSRQIAQELKELRTAR